MNFWDSIKNALVSTYDELGVIYLVLMVVLLFVNVYMQDIYKLIIKQNLVDYKRVVFVSSVITVLIFIAFLGARVGRSLLIMFAVFGLYEYYDTIITRVVKKYTTKFIAFVKSKVSKGS